MAQWSSYQLHTLMDVSSSLASGPSLLVWVKRESNRTMRGLNGAVLGKFPAPGSPYDLPFYTNRRR